MQMSKKYGLNRLLTVWKNTQAPWLYDVPNCALQECLRNQDQAFKNFWRRCANGDGRKGFPRYKGRRDGAAFTLRGAIRVDGRRIALPWARGQSLGSVRLKERGFMVRRMAKDGIDPEKTTIKSATISERAGRWFVSMLVEEEVPEPRPATNAPMGADLGSRKLLTLSDGTYYESPHALKGQLRKLRRLNREFSRRYKRGKPLTENARKTLAKIASVHFRIACIRQNAAHQVTHDVIASANPSVLCIEDLHVQGMMQNTRLARTIADAGMGEVKRQLEYKAKWHGVEIVHADRFFPSSKTCSDCGCIKTDLGSSEVFRCRECGLVIDRDLNAARNLQKVAAKSAETQNALGGGCLEEPVDELGTHITRGCEVAADAAC